VAEVADLAAAGQVALAVALRAVADAVGAQAAAARARAVVGPLPDAEPLELALDVLGLRQRLDERRVRAGLPRDAEPLVLGPPPLLLARARLLALPPPRFVSRPAEHVERRHAREQQGAGDGEERDARLARAAAAAVPVARARRPARHPETEEAHGCDVEPEDHRYPVLVVRRALAVFKFCPFCLVAEYAEELAVADDGDAHAEPERDRIAPRRRRVVGPARHDVPVPFVVVFDSDPPAAVLLALDVAQAVKHCPVGFPAHVAVAAVVRLALRPGVGLHVHACLVAADGYAPEIVADPVLLVA